ncbi:hypothetical protein MRX96_029437 [Rhipicephalus microplus]
MVVLCWPMSPSVCFLASCMCMRLCRGFADNERALSFLDAVPPGDPVILDEDGKQLQGLVGPYNEGDPLTLTCQVEVGKPRPAVTWWKDYAQLDESYFFSPDGSLVKNKLEVAAITRNDLLATFTCQAANNNITIPASVSITLDLNPLEPRLIYDVSSDDLVVKEEDLTKENPPERPLSANKEVELVCSSSGSRPPATLTWWKGGQQVRSARDSEDTAGGAGGGGGLSASTSVLLFTPTVDDNNRIPVVSSREQGHTRKRARGRLEARSLL